jgi:predicted dehydrogenase
MSNVSRRKFLEESLLAAAAATFAGSCASRKASAPGGAQASAGPAVVVPAAAPSDRLRVAVVGVNGRGMAHVRDFSKRSDAEVVAICDVDEQAFGKARDMVYKTTSKAPVYHRDLRKLLEDKSIDIVAIATPNHWHALASVWAIQAGKDVFVEKPVSHNVHEGRVVVEMARKHGRIVQTGSQSRSNPGMRQFIEYVQSGKLGKVTLARGLCYKRRDSIGKVASAGAPPASVDYDLWLGPAPARKDVPRQKFHYDWHWQWDYGGGDIANQGVHEIDKARWGLGKNTMPSGVIAVGGRFGYQDDGETANTQVCVYDYGDAKLIFEVRGLPSDELLGAKVGNIFYGSEGYAVSTNYSSGTIFDLKGNKVAHFSGGSSHVDNFIKAVRSRKHTDLTADIAEGHLSAALCHLGNISYRLGKAQPLGSKPSSFGGPETEEALGRFEAHLTDNGIAAGKASFHLGPRLAIDTARETFSDGGKEALALLSREYRSGFVVPARV